MLGKIVCLGTTLCKSDAHLLHSFGMVAIVSTMSTWLSGSLHWISSTLIRNCVHYVWQLETPGQRGRILKKNADSSPLRSRRPWWTPWNAPVQCLFVNWKAPTSPNMQLLNPSICTSLHWFQGSADLCAALNCDDRWSAGATQEPPWRTSLVTWVGTTTLLKRRPLTKVHKLIVNHKLLYQLLYYVAFQLGSCFINNDNEADFHGGSN